jgi:hypothetical protein
MTYTHEFYELTKAENTMPGWVKSESLFNCESLIKVFSFFKNR